MSSVPACKERIVSGADHGVIAERLLVALKTLQQPDTVDSGAGDAPGGASQ